MEKVINKGPAGLILKRLYIDAGLTLLFYYYDLEVSHIEKKT